MNNIQQQTKYNSVYYGILIFLLLVTIFNYADRATLPTVAPMVSKELGFGPEVAGLAFSVSGISYVIMQVPDDWLLDKCGSQLTYGCALTGWPVVTMFQGIVYLFVSPLMVLMTLRLMMEAIEAPAFPVNSRLSIRWFPDKERRSITSVYQAVQYILLGTITPLITIIPHNLSWRHIFYYIGAIRVVLGVFWLVKVKDSSHHPKIDSQEPGYIREGGNVPELGSQKMLQELTLAQIESVCVNRMTIEAYTGQFCVILTTWFFLTWFPTYFHQAKDMSILKIGFVASIPAIAGFISGPLGSVFSDWLSKRGYSLTIARKFLVIYGTLPLCVIVIVNCTSSEVVAIAAMSLVLFTKGFGGLDWCMLSDTSPKEMFGIADGVLNMCGNLVSIITPLVTGVTPANTHLFDCAILYVDFMDVLGLFSYLFIVGPLDRLMLTPRTA